MVKLHTLGAVTIHIYAGDHLPPHFHVMHPDFEALIVIRDLTYYAGEIPARFRREVLAWAKDNQVALVAEWNRYNPRFPC